MKYSGSDDSMDLVTPDDVLSEQQLERFSGEPEKNRIGAPGHEEWSYDDATIYSTEAYGFLSDLVEDDVLRGERALTDMDVDRLRGVAAQVKGVKRPVGWIDESAYEKAGLEDDLPIQGRFYFSGEVPMETELRSSEDLAQRLSFLRSPSEVDADDVIDDVEEVESADAGMIDRIEEHLVANDFVVPVVYADNMPVKARNAAFVYQPGDQSGLSDDFDRFVESLSDRKKSALEAELNDAYTTDSGHEDDPVSIDPGMPERPPELRSLKGESGKYRMTFYAQEYSDPGDFDVEFGAAGIEVVDSDGEEIASRDVEFDEEIDTEELADLEVEEIDLNNGVGTAIFSE